MIVKDLTLLLTMRSVSASATSTASVTAVKGLRTQVVVHGAGNGGLAVTSEWVVVRGGHRTHIHTTVTHKFWTASPRLGQRLRAPSQIIVIVIIVVFVTGWRVKELVQGIPTGYSNVIVKGCLYVSCPVFVALLLLLLNLLLQVLLIMSILLVMRI
jgi:hypothetical protein